MEKYPRKTKFIEQISIETFQEHFTKSTPGSTTKPHTNTSEADGSLTFDPDLFLNQPFTNQEEKNIKKLINNKTAGHDMVYTIGAPEKK